MKQLITLLATFALCAMTLSGLQAQTKTVPASPAKEATGKIGNADVTINYSSPGVKGRTIWGELVPYDAVWRAGANAATTVTTNKDLLIDGEDLPAGTYSFFVIPKEDDAWTVILNKKTEAWGSFDHDEKSDVLRVKVDPKESEEMTERLTYDVKDGMILLIWENVMLPIPAKVK